MRKVGGFSALTIGVFYAVITILYIASGKLPDDPTKTLEHLNNNRAEWTGIIVLSIITDFLYIPFLLSLFSNLNRSNLYKMIAGSAFIVLFVVIDLIITWPGYTQLLLLSENWKDLLKPNHSSNVVFSVSTLLKTLNSPLSAFYLIFLPSIGIIFICLALSKSTFGIITKVLGYITGLAGMISSIGFIFLESFGVGFVITSVLTLLWLIAIGYKLLKPIDP